MPSIRPYRPSDEDAIIHIFRVTASPELQKAGDPAIHYASYIWARPYISLVPEHCLVLDDDNGTAVGYVLGVPNTTNFVAEYRETYLVRLRSSGMFKPVEVESMGDERASEDGTTRAIERGIWQPEQMLHGDSPNLVAQYPAHLHIDILPEYQSQGWGLKMLSQLLAKFANLGVPGIHLGKTGSNVRAGKFYAKLGFTRFSECMDGGKSGEVGRVSDGGVYLVKTL